MLRALVLDGVDGEVDDTDVVVVDKRTPSEGAVKLLEELAQPARFRHSISNTSRSTGVRDNRLTLGGPRDEVVPKEHCITQHEVDRWVFEHLAQSALV